MSSDRRGRVLLVGQGPTATTALRSLLASHDVVGLLRCASPDDATTTLAHEAHVPVHGEVTIGTLRTLLDEVQPDCVVVSSFDRVLPSELLRACRFVNVHYSPLPCYRGRANVNWAVINGEPEAAISVHQLVTDLDAGGILYQERIPIGPRTTAADLYEKLNGIQERELGAAVSRLLAGDPGRPQDPTAATYGCTRIPDDGELDWASPTEVLDRLVRGLTPPAPGAFTFLGLQRLWVDVAEPAPEAPRYEGRVPGRVVGISRAEGWADVLTGNGVLRLHRVRVEDGAAVPAADVLRSVRTTLGLRTTDLVRELLDLRARLATGGPGAESST